MKPETVSVIVTTYNNSRTLDACLSSIGRQTYDPIELIVVDNNSQDDTKEIARRYTDKVFDKGPERCAQRNYGVEQSTGEYVIIIDSDMELTENVVTDVVDQFAVQPDAVGLVIPEESFGEGFWAACKRLERSYYVGVPWMEAARAFRRTAYDQAGGYDETMVSGEDWDLSQRIERLGRIGRIRSYIRHNEGHLKLATTLKKKYYYAGKFAAYTAKNKSTENVSSQTDVFGRYKLFLSKPARLFKNPLLGAGMLFMKTSEFAVGYFGMKRKGA